MVQVPNSKDELDRVFAVRPLGFVVAHVDDSSEDKEEEMASNQRKGLRDLFVGRKKGSASKDALESQPSLLFPLPFLSPQPACSLSLT